MSRRKPKKSRFVAKRKKRSRLGSFSILLVLILLSCAYIWQRVTIITLSAQTKELRLKIKKQQETRKYLQVEVTNLNSIQRIERKGKKMGLLYPKLDQIGLIHESSDSTYLEMQGFAKNIWAKLKTLQKDILSSDEAIAKEIGNEP